jgi:NADP-dependent 3-hydroxy acid dehydrogenase YdfG
MARRKLAGAAVVIMGASSSIGQGTAEAFRKRAPIELASAAPRRWRRSPSPAEPSGAQAHTSQTDIVDTEAVRRLEEWRAIGSVAPPSG